jgi:hypothetical protein
MMLSYISTLHLDKDRVCRAICRLSETFYNSCESIIIKDTAHSDFKFYPLNISFSFFDTDFGWYLVAAYYSQIYI